MTTEAPALAPAPPAWVRWTGAAVALIALVVFVFAVVLFRTYCENFGCIGVGIAWAMWSAGYAFALALAAIARRIQRRHRVGDRVSSIAFFGLMLLGLSLFAYWLVQGRN